MSNKFINKEIYYSIVLLCAPLIVLFSIYFYSNRNGFDIQEEIKTQPAIVVESLRDTVPNPFDHIKITARAGLVKDLNTGKIIYSKNENQPMALASITKVMTALTAYSKSSNLENYAFITPNSLMVEGNTFLSLGEKFLLKDLIDLILITSSNHGSVALAESIENTENINFVFEMNSLAREIGMNDSHFLNVTGLDENDNTAGAFGTAIDVGKMFKYALKNYPEMFESTKSTEFNRLSASGILHRNNNTNSVIPEFNNLIASKTGFTEIAGGNLAVVVDPGLNSPVLIVVLGSTRQGRFDDVLKLSNKLGDYYEYKISN